MPATLRKRITYLVGPDEEAEALTHASVSSLKHTQISDLTAAKHVRIRATGVDLPAGAEDFRFTWSQSPLSGLRATGQPFDPPCDVGVRVDAPNPSNWPSLANWVTGHFQTRVFQNAIDAESWLSFASSEHTAPDLGAFGVPAGANAVRVLGSKATGELILEAWYPVQSWTEELVSSDNDEKVEIGIFGVSGTPNDLILSGRVRDLASAKSSPVRFHTHPRARPVSEGTVDVRFNKPYGLHPTLRLNVSIEKPPARCNLFTKIDLPPSVFMDRHQMKTDVEEKENLQLVGLWGETDLESPVWAVNQGSIALMLLDSPNAVYEVPLHFRYAEPSESLYLSETFPAPLVFWACEDTSLEPPYPEFGYIGDNGFGGVASAFPLDDTAFYYAATTETAFQIPAIGPSHGELSGKVTSITILVGSLLILLAVIRQFMATRSTTSRASKIEEDAKTHDEAVAVTHTSSSNKTTSQNSQRRG